MGRKRKKHIYIDLVKDCQVEPIAGNKIDLPIKQEGLLVTRGKTIYTIPFDSRKRREDLNYIAELRDDSVFPLQKPVSVNLKLSYSYGSAQPYELTFSPLSKDKSSDGFRPLRAKWKKPDDLDPEDARSPGFPNRREWTYFRKYPSADGKTLDLVDWVVRNLEFRQFKKILKPLSLTINTEDLCSGKSVQ